MSNELHPIPDENQKNSSVLEVLRAQYALRQSEINGLNANINDLHRQVSELTNTKSNIAQLQHSIAEKGLNILRDQAELRFHEERAEESKRLVEMFLPLTELLQRSPDTLIASSGALLNQILNTDTTATRIIDTVESPLPNNLANRGSARRFGAVSPKQSDAVKVALFAEQDTPSMALLYHAKPNTPEHRVLSEYSAFLTEGKNNFVLSTMFGVDISIIGDQPYATPFMLRKDIRQGKENSNFDIVGLGYDDPGLESVIGRMQGIIADPKKEILLPRSPKPQNPYLLGLRFP